MMITTQVCPNCGLPLPSKRFGVVMTPLQMRIVEAIMRAGLNGITGADLRDVIYGDRTVTRQAIYVHVHAINNKLAATNYRIHAGMGNGSVYRMMKRSERSSAA